MIMYGFQIVESFYQTIKIDALKCKVQYMYKIYYKYICMELYKNSLTVIL
jgi:hypothetical protein